MKKIGVGRVSGTKCCLCDRPCAFYSQVSSSFRDLFNYVLSPILTKLVIRLLGLKPVKNRAIG